MPVQKGKSGLMAKYGAKLDTIVKKHANDATDYGQMRLPPGITNGVAQVVESKFDIYKSGTNKGEYYYRAAGVVLEPQSVTIDGQEIPVAGLQTSYMEPVCDTKTQAGKVVSQAEHVENILNEMRKLGGEEMTKEATGADLESLAEQLKELKPYFKFSTSVRKALDAKQTDGIWENWYGGKGLDNYAPPDASAAVDDDTGAAEATDGDGASSDSSTVSSESPGDHEIDELVERSNADDSDAQVSLGEMAESVGCPKDEVEAAENWDAVAVLIRAARDGGGAAEPSEQSTPEEWSGPEKEQIFKYKPIDPKTKKPFTDLKTKKERSPVECEVTGVDKKTKTCTLKNLQNTKLTYSKVSWDDLLPGE